MNYNWLTTLIVFIIICSMTNAQQQRIKSKLEIFNIENNHREIIYEEDNLFEAPNWSIDGTFLIVNSSGKLFKIDINTKNKSYINTDFADKLNNDHGISPDGKQLVISHHDQPDIKFENSDFRTSRIYTVPISGGIPKIVTKKTPSFWHGWSPDGKRLVYTALRNGNFDIYSISVEGGNEIRLTSEVGLDDGPDYSHDGKYIYYNSMKSGKMEIWKMLPDGSMKEQITDDKYSNWFPHPSPSGTYLVFLSYLEDQGDRHPAMKEVALRLINLKKGEIKTLCTFIGGQGTINVPSWSPGGKKFAFVSYQYLY